MDAEQRKKQILECAKKLFASRGYYQTQISDIQHAAGVARGTIYQYFKNKDDIFATILENLFVEWKGVLSKIPDNDSEDFKSGIKFFRYKIKNSFEFFADDPDYCNILLKIGLGLGENFDMLIRRFDVQMVDLTNKYLKAGIRQNRIKPDIDLELLSNLIGGALMRMAYYYGVTKKDKDAIDIDQLTERFVNAFSYGIFMEKTEN
jgi:AcrR family transcriptional regulator